MPFYKKIKYALFFFLWFNFVFSQNYPTKSYTAANKLPNNAVRSLLVDSNNILWIGTENGVVKKENDDFKYFFEEDGLALNSCWAIAEDPNNNLWFGSYGEGISVYDGHKFKIISKKDGLVHNEIISLFSKGNHMYVGTSDGISIIDVSTFEVKSLKPESNETLFRVPDFFEYLDQIYVVSYDSGLFRIEVKEDIISLVKVDDQKFNYAVFVDNDSIYSSNKDFFTKTTLAGYINKKDSLPLKKYGNSIIWDYIKTSKAEVFAAAWGIYDSDGGIYEIKDDQMISKASEFNIPSKEVISLGYDPLFRKLYVGTKAEGLFEVSLEPEIKLVDLKGKDVLGFANANNTTAVLFSDGIAIKENGEAKHISRSNFKEWQENYLLETSLPLPEHKDDFYELDYSIKAEDINFYDIKANKNSYWVNSNIGIFSIRDSGELDRYLPLHSEEINFTADGELIETHPYGGVRVYKDLDTFNYLYFCQKYSYTPTMVVNSLQKGEKTYFLSIFTGLYVWENNSFKSYLNNNIWKEKKLKHITALEENLAISSEFGDVFIVNDEADFFVVKKIPRAKIQGNSISFLEDYNGTLIIGTEKGLTLYKDNRFVFIDEEQGLKQPLFSATVTENKLIIGSKDGYNILDLDAIINKEALVDQLEVKEIFVNNNKFPLAPLTSKEELNLAHNQNTLLVKFSTNAHPYPNKLKYQYRLDDSENWSLPTSNHEIFLPYLPSHQYKLDVKVLDQSTGRSYTQPLLAFTILPPFWQTWWFMLLIICTLSLIIYGIYNYQIAQTQKFEKQKGLIQKRFEETKMEALLAQMNPHFIFNAMNSIQYYIMDSDIDKATIFLGDFAKLIRLNLDHCTRPTILLIEEIEYLQLYTRVENTRFNHAIKVIFEIDPLIDTYDVKIPTMLLQTFVENIFVHAFPKSIENPSLKISFKLLSENVLQCKIEDNGIGFSNSSNNNLHQSRGVTLVKERLALLGYDIEKAVAIISEKNKGTTISLKLDI